MKLSKALVPMLLIVLAACGPTSRDDGNGGGGDDDGDDDSSGGFVDAAPFEEGPDAGMQAACEQIDFLFVIDDSGSMGEEQDNLAANFPAFVSVIDAFMTAQGTPIDYRIAITTTGRDLTYTEDLPPIVLPIPIPGFPNGIDPPPISMSQTGPDGELVQGCGMPRKWIERADPGVATTFACAADVGVGGSSTEMPLYATKLALGDRVTTGNMPNAGFLRENALLAVIILSDENDCSREDNNFTSTTAGGVCADAELRPVADYVAFLDTVKGARGRWATAVIAGDTDCSSDFGDAVQATRLQQFVEQTGENAIFSSICAGDLATALMDAIETFDAACQSFPPIG